MLLVFFSMAVLSLIGYLTIDPVFLMLGASPELLPLIHSYLDVYYPTIVLFTMTMVTGNIMRANGNANVPGLVMTLGALANLAIDPILIFGWFGATAYGAGTGAAVAAAISRFGTAAVLIYYVHHGAGIITTRNLFAGFCVLLPARIMQVGLSCHGHPAHRPGIQRHHHPHAGQGTAKWW